MIKRVRGGSIEDLKLRREGEQERKPEYILTDVLQVWFQAIPLVGGLKETVPSVITRPHAQARDRFFNILKRVYGGEINMFIQAHINHISKVEFFLVFHAAYEQSMT